MNRDKFHAPSTIPYPGRDAVTWAISMSLRYDPIHPSSEIYQTLRAWFYDTKGCEDYWTQYGGFLEHYFNVPSKKVYDLRTANVLAFVCDTCGLLAVGDTHNRGQEDRWECDNASFVGNEVSCCPGEVRFAGYIAITLPRAG